MKASAPRVDRGHDASSTGVLVRYSSDVCRHRSRFALVVSDPSAGARNQLSKDFGIVGRSVYTWFLFAALRIVPPFLDLGYAASVSDFCCPLPTRAVDFEAVRGSGPGSAPLRRGSSGERWSRRRNSPQGPQWSAALCGCPAMTPSGRDVSSPCDMSFHCQARIVVGVCRLIANHPHLAIFRKHAKSQGPLLLRRYAASTLQRSCPTPAVAATTEHYSDVPC